MRLASAAVAVLALALIATPASAAQIDPAELVLREADIPVGFELNREESGIRSNGTEIKEYPEARVLVRWGRLTGYQAAYTRKTRKLALVYARADVFRGTDGARPRVSKSGHGLTEAGAGRHRGPRMGPLGHGHGARPVRRRVAPGQSVCWSYGAWTHERPHIGARSRSTAPDRRSSPLARDHSGSSSTPTPSATRVT
jgi:hypothetical protein